MARDDPSVTSVRLLVRLHDGASRRHVRDAVVRALGPRDDAGRSWRIEPLLPGHEDPLLRQYWLVNGAVPSIAAYDPTRTAFDLAARLSAVPGVEAEPDLPSSAFGAEPPDSAAAVGLPTAAAFLPGLGGAHLPASENPTWALDAVRARAAWKLALPAGGRPKGEGVVIASVDTGYTDHPEVAGMYDLTRDWDVLAHDEDARDPLDRSVLMPFASPGHGTQTSSVVASRETLTIVGVAPASTVVPIRAVKSVVQVLDSDVARAVDEARRRGCHVVTMSLGGAGFHGLRQAIRVAVDSGMIVMAAAGNQVGVVVAPAIYPECLAVAASNVEERPWAGSSRGAAVDISAPGESVWVAAVDGSRPPVFRERRSSGTSYAVACLAGVAALWLAHHGHDAVVARYGRANVQAAFLSLLRTRGRHVPAGWDTRRFGAGIVDAHGLLSAGLPDLPGLTAVRANALAAEPAGRLSGVLDDRERDDVRARVATSMGLTGADVDALPPHAVKELVYRLGEDHELRRALLHDERQAEEPDRAVAGRLLARTCSRSLLACGRSGEGADAR